MNRIRGSGFNPSPMRVKSDSSHVELFVMDSPVNEHKQAKASRDPKMSKIKSGVINPSKQTPARLRPFKNDTTSIKPAKNLSKIESELNGFFVTGQKTAIESSLYGVSLPVVPGRALALIPETQIEVLMPMNSPPK